jgi:glycosyltransferase involved in cell wall biosynthesis
MNAASAWVLAAGFALVAYTYVGYPLLLILLGALRGRRRTPGPPTRWPALSLLLPVYNEEAVIRETLENLLQLDYPGPRPQIVVVSDASTDGTDAIVSAFAGRGVRLLRLPRRSGKTAAENAALPLLTGEIIVHTDASVRVERGALTPLIASFGDPTVGVASSHNVSVARIDAPANYAESWYVGYDMWVRDLETGVSGIVGAAGCFYAARAAIHRDPLPDGLSPDFAAALIARERGFRTVSVRNAVCFVPRIPSLSREYRRKVRTIARGWHTLHFKSALLNPFRYGAFAWILASHKVCRWLMPHVGVLVIATLAWWARGEPGALAGVGIAGVAALCAVVGWVWPEGRRLPRVLAVPAYVVIGNLAALHASLRALSGESLPTWEPTRREPARRLEVG